MMGYHEHLMERIPKNANTGHCHYCQNSLMAVMAVGTVGIFRKSQVNSGLWPAPDALIQEWRSAGQRRVGETTEIKRSR